ncbi:DnaJ domain [uncultured Caudovirales phage]|uniref:DnaJ domain n=1 Tax=uncultured Caudovirales phage TaxID=2100421 RepID=A0A6J5M874_9CAUD|nr:DnaJ domain [uncultured Caudovirales phage]CAB4211780.1 DnaJ domain [uncultured Caudovirales phage]
MTSPFEILGLADTASIDEVRQAYIRLAKVRHPDMGGNAEEFSKLGKAFRQALAMAGLKKCMQCDGKGWVGLFNGFHSVKMTCTMCRGSGNP